MKAFKIPGWIHVNELVWLARQAKNCDLIIEVGTWLGRSTSAMAGAVKGIVLTVDSFSFGPVLDKQSREVMARLEQDPDWLYKQCLINLDEPIRAGKVKVFRATSDDAILWLRKYTGQADMVFIDGDHSYPGVKNDIINYRSLLRGGGLLCGHDFNWEGVRQAVTELLPNAKPAVRSIWACRC